MTATRLVAADDRRHVPAPGGKMRDSLFWNLILPEEDLACQVYAWVDERGIAGSQVTVFGPGVGEPVVDHSSGIDVGETDFDDWRVAGFHLSQPEALRTAVLEYEGGEISLDYSYSAVHPAFDYAQNAIGCPPWMAQNRFEQTGRAKGVLSVAGRLVAFDAPAHRDHSWGRRNWRYPHHWKWVAAQTASGDTAVNVHIWVAKGEVGVNGYVLREGTVVPLVDARAHADYDAHMMQRRLDAELIDERGGVTHLVVDRYAIVPLPSFGSGTSVLEAACRVTIDGEPGQGQFECLWPTEYFEHLVVSEVRQT